MWLGYEDDQYDDNGYWRHDAGTENQCAGSNDSVTVTIGIIRSGLPVVPGNYPPPQVPNSGPQTTLFYLGQQITSPTDTMPNGAWANTFGVLARGKVLEIQNQNAFAVELVVDNHSTAECFKDTSATVVLGPKATTTPAQLAQIFTLGPNFPRPIVACAYAGTSPPQLLAFTITYQPQP
jgi:hypothetical protein